MILVNSLRYHLFSLLQRHKENAKTFNPPLLFLRVWRLEEIQTLPFPREIFLPPCPQDTIPSQACIFDLPVLHSPGRVTGLPASRNSTMLMGTGTVTRVSQSYPLKHIGRLITRDRKAARAITVFLFSPSSPPIPTAILHVFYCSPKNDFVWESFQRFSKKSVHGSAFIFRKRMKREKVCFVFFQGIMYHKVNSKVFGFMDYLSQSRQEVDVFSKNIFHPEMISKKWNSWFMCCSISDTVTNMYLVQIHCVWEKKEFIVVIIKICWCHFKNCLPKEIHLLTWNLS